MTVDLLNYLNVQLEEAELIVKKIKKQIQKENDRIFKKFK